jgi:hypothetical protein
MEITKNGGKCSQLQDSTALPPRNQLAYKSGRRWVGYRESLRVVMDGAFI